MKPLAVATCVLALGGAVSVAVVLANSGSSTAENLAATLAMAERPVAAATARATAAAAAPSAPAATPATAASAPAAPAPSAAAAAAPAVAAPAAHSSAEPKPMALDALPPALSFRQTNTYNGAIVYVPEGCHDTYDLVMHFHGAHPYVKDLIEKANINAVVAVFNAGNGAEKYSQAYGAGGTLSSLLRQIDMATTPLCPGAKAGRVALTAWSAGYGAAERLVSREEDRARVDAILLADGLHAGFMDPWKRNFAPNALQAFRDFGELAKANQKLFAITHSSIVTDGYASTTECSKLLLQALNVPCESTLISGRSGDCSIEGFTGEDKAAHIVQFRQMDVNLLSKLRARWQGEAG
ncbi:MAG TPA: hypothetical protein VHP33_29785 [Polyangiaceae bacterium]|nr:hypothetical protein [Polyangiaceae bacterium]